MRPAQTKIDPKEISVVVQGAIAGSPNDPPKKQHTRICLESIRRHLPGATIILSTWKGSNVAGLDYDVLVENDDPGSNLMENYRSNCFRQIVSSLNGLRRAKTKYAMKIRGDLELKSADFLDYFVTYNLAAFDENYKILKHRVVTITACNPHRRYKRPFVLSDWFHFGLTEDVTNIFDIPLVEKKIVRKDADGVERTITNPYYPEQYIWHQFLSKYKEVPFEYADDISHDNIAVAEKYFANNCILLNTKQIKLKWLKFPGKAYAQTPSLSNSGLYTFNEYKKMLNAYANNHLIIIPDIPEEVTYFIVYNLRYIVKRTLVKFRGFFA